MEHETLALSPGTFLPDSLVSAVSASAIGANEAIRRPVSAAKNSVPDSGTVFSRGCPPISLRPFCLMTAPGHRSNSFQH